MHVDFRGQGQRNDEGSLREGGLNPRYQVQELKPPMRCTGQSGGRGHALDEIQEHQDKAGAVWPAGGRGLRHAETEMLYDNVVSWVQKDLISRSRDLEYGRDKHLRI